MKAGSFLERSLKAGRFVVTAEIMPPKTPGARLVKKRTEAMKGYITAANLTDNQSAVVRMASMAASKLVMDTGIEPVMQITCRDRNRLAMQSDVLGAAALGIRNILCVTGDHQRFGNHPEAKNVYDLDSMHLITMLRRMRDDGIFLNGEPIRNRKKAKIVPPRLFIGAAANPFGSPRHFRPFRLAKKVRAGADFIQTQPIFDLEGFAAWLREVRDLGVLDKTAVLAGITPVKSVKSLMYMRENVPGIFIPDDVIRRMASASDPEREGFEMASETISAVRRMDGVRGIHLMAIGWEKIVPLLVEELDLYPDFSLMEKEEND